SASWRSGSRRSGDHEKRLRSAPASPDHREVHEAQGRAAHARLRGAPRRHQARDQEGGGVAVRGQGAGSPHRERPRQGQAAGPLRGPPRGLEEGLRRPEEGREDGRVLRPGIREMSLKNFNPTSPGRRFMTHLTFDEITKTTPEKSLTEPLKNTGARDS